MISDYRINVSNKAGVLQAVITDPISFTYTRIVNAPGILVMEIRGDHPILTNIEENWLIEVYRRPKGYSWRKEFSGFYQDIDWIQEDVAPRASLSAYGSMVMLSWRVSGYTANMADRTAFSNKPAETIAKTLVEYNAGPSATLANGRETDGVISGLSVETDAGTGKSMDWFCAWQNLLETLQKLAESGGGDFDLVTGGSAYQFRWYDGQLGIDRSSDVVFALQRGNMANPRYRERRSSRLTSVIVGGKGEEEEREIAIVKSDDFSASDNYEGFLGATDVDTEAGLINRGQAKLAENRIAKEFYFTVLQSEASKYGVHYDLGDLVSAINPFNGAVYKMQVKSVNVALEKDGKETINIELKRLDDV